MRNTGKYKDTAPSKVEDDDVVWCVNQAGKVYPMQPDHIFAQSLMGTLDPKFAETVLTGWRLATPNEITEAKKDMAEQGKKWQAVRQAELDKKQPKVVVLDTKEKDKK